jgi:16S rRNA (guanine527-N7)-methyltransferase
MDHQQSPSTHNTVTPGPGLDAAQAARALGRGLSAAQLASLNRYVDILLGANQRLNLTAVRDRAGVEQRHIIESLALVRLLEELAVVAERSAVIDVGSGGGLPGVPLAIARPDVRVTLLEATGKKAAFLREAAMALDLANVGVLARRAEEAGQDTGHREMYELAVARAVAPLDVLAELMLPLVRVGGAVAAVKGANVAEELATARAAVAQCGGSIARVETREAMGAEPLTVVLIAKIAPAPPELPRRPGMPAKRPLR